jgi:hypothetical protein
MRNAQGQKRNCTNALGIARFRERLSRTRIPALPGFARALKASSISASRLRRLGTAREINCHVRTALRRQRHTDSSSAAAARPPEGGSADQSVRGARASRRLAYTSNA